MLKSQWEICPREAVFRQLTVTSALFRYALVEGNLKGGFEHVPQYVEARHFETGLQRVVGGEVEEAEHRPITPVIDHVHAAEVLVDVGETRTLRAEHPADDRIVHPTVRHDGDASPVTTPAVLLDERPHPLAQLPIRLAAEVGGVPIRIGAGEERAHGSEDRRDLRAAEVARLDLPERIDGDHAGTVPSCDGLGGRLRTAERARVDRVERHRDRKSTRLNSSHRCISYAVFCLKKK